MTSDNGHSANGHKRAVIYARVSGDDRGKEGRNLESQLEMGREYCQRKGYIVVEELPEDDKGASGAEIDLPMLTRALELAEAREYDVLIVREIDRLSRNLAKQLIVEEELKRAEVAIEYVLGDYPNTPEGNLMKQVRGSIAEYEREKIKERMVRGRRNVVKRGSVMVSQHPPYGYQVVETVIERTEDAEGRMKEIKRRRLEVCEAEARIVRLIFQWYTDAKDPMTINGITRRLAELNIPTPSEGNRRKTRRKQRGVCEWTRAVVHDILTNETYIGRWHYGKSTQIREKVNGKTRYHILRNPREHWITLTVPAMIDAETWDAAQERLDYNRRNGWKPSKSEFLMRQRLTCGECGARMRCASASGRNRHDYYMCNAHRKPLNSPRLCHAPCFRADRVDYVVWQWVRDILSDPAQLQKAMAEFEAENEREAAPLRERLQTTDRLLADYRAQLERVLDLYIRGDFDRSVLTERKSRLEDTVKRLTKERDSLAARLAQQLQSNAQLQAALKFAEAQRANVERATKEFTVRRGLIEDLQVNITLAVENGEKVVYARCVVGEQRILLGVNLNPC